MRERRLGDMKLVGGASEVTVPGDRLGVSQLAKLDGERPVRLGTSRKQVPLVLDD
jgi:hypothetical protein